MSIALYDELKRQLQSIKICGIIEKVREPTLWVNPIVIAMKTDGKIRLCLDPTELNKYILREHYIISSFEELSAKMAHVKIFSTLDADRAFWQIKLSAKSTNLATFITPFGR